MPFSKVMNVEQTGITKACRIIECRAWLSSSTCHAEWGILFVVLSNRISLVCEDKSLDSERAAYSVLHFTVLFGSVSHLLLDSRLSGRRIFCFQGNGGRNTELTITGLHGPKFRTSSISFTWNSTWCSLLSHPNIFWYCHDKMVLLVVVLKTELQSLRPSFSCHGLLDLTLFWSLTSRG